MTFGQAVCIAFAIWVLLAIADMLDGLEYQVATLEAKLRNIETDRKEPENADVRLN